MNRFTFVIVILLVFSVCAEQLPNPQMPVSTVEERIQQIENGRYTSDGKSIAKRMLARKISGLSIAVINNGEIEWARGYGVVESRSTQLVNTSIIFQAASISKPLTALAAIRMVQNGMLALDEDVNQKLVTWKVPENKYTVKEKVTLRRLLSHNAGTTVHGFRGYSAGEPVPNLLQVLQGASPANSAPVTVKAVPGKEFRYSGGGISIVQQLIVDVTGVPFPDFMRKTVLEPLNMKDSTFAQPLPIERFANAAVAHKKNGKPIAGKWHTYPEIAAAGLWTTPSDLARMIIEIQRSLHGESDRIISALMTKEMLSNQSARSRNWGLGFELGGQGKDAWFQHVGLNEGFTATFIGFNELGQGAVIMTNSDQCEDLRDIIKSIARVYQWP